MKRKIRKNLFETNSSSVHTLAYKNAKWANPDLPINPETGKVIGRLGKFGKGYRYYETQAEKLSYLLTAIWCFCDKDFEEAEDSWCFRDLEEIIMDHCDCTGLEIDRLSEGYIDHQCYPDYGECELFDLTKFNMENFIFNDNIMLHTDCD